MIPKRDLAENCVYAMWSLPQIPEMQKLTRTYNGHELPIGELLKIADEIVKGKRKGKIAEMILAEAVAIELGAL